MMAGRQQPEGGFPLPGMRPPPPRPPGGNPPWGPGGGAKWRDDGHVGRAWGSEDGVRPTQDRTPGQGAQGWGDTWRGRSRGLGDRAGERWYGDKKDGNDGGPGVDTAPLGGPQWRQGGPLPGVPQGARMTSVALPKPPPGDPPAYPPGHRGARDELPAHLAKDPNRILTAREKYLVQVRAFCCIMRMGEIQQNEISQAAKQAAADAFLDGSALQANVYADSIEELVRTQLASTQQ